MADIIVTAANVQPGAGAVINRSYNFGAAVLAGQSVYLDTDTNTWKLCDADASAAAAALGGIAMHGGANGQPAAVLTGGRYTVGGTVAVGEIYVGSGNPGGIAPKADLATADWVSILGIGVSATQIAVQIQVSGVQVP